MRDQNGDRSVTKHSVPARFVQARSDPSLAVLEGFHPLKHAIRFGAELLDVVTPDLEKVKQLAGELAPDVIEGLKDRLTEVSASVFAGLAPVAPVTGVIAIARRPSHSLHGTLIDPAPPPLIYLEKPSNLSNVGAVIRVAAAVGAGGVLTSGVHDPWQAAAIRGAAGLHFAVPVLHVESLPPCDRPLLAIDPDGEPLQRSQIPERAILAFGTERGGLTSELLSKADARVSLPMREGISSLNLATAVAAVLYIWRLAE